MVKTTRCFLLPRLTCVYQHLETKQNRSIGVTTADMSDKFVENHEFKVPERAILSMQDMAKWKVSEAYQEYRGFLLAINDAVKGKAHSSCYPESESIQIMLQLLNEIDDWIDRFPPIDQPQRFGNQAFRSFYNYLKQESHILLRKYLPEKFHSAIPEVSVYLVEGFGNSTRIDYGTGHELAFLWHLSCLFKIGFFPRDDKCAVGLKVFDRYLQLVRKLQTTYRMEPAGSRGVWSLDDFQFVPFIWGSSQLIGNPRIEPSAFFQPDVVNTYSNDFLFIGCINYINQVKSGPFFEHSNQLYNLSGVDNWGRVNQGLMKMYENEVLSSFPVVQHILFGSLMPITASTKQSAGPPGSRFRPPVKVDISQLPPPEI